MKKIISLALVLWLCLSLLACNTPPEPSSTGTTNGTDNNTGTGFVEVPKPDALPTSGWVARARVDGEAFAVAEEGLFYILNQCLYFLDTDTGYSVGLCGKPGCSHGEENDPKKRIKCDAYISGFVSMMFYHDGSLYYAINEDTCYELYTRSQDGTNFQKQGVLGSQYASQNTSVQMGEWVFAYGKLYYTLSVTDIIIKEDGTVTSDNLTNILVQRDISTGEELELLRSKDELISLLGANEDMALIWMSYQITREDLDRPDYIDYIKQFPAYLRLWHKKGNGVSTLCEMDRESSNASIGFANGKYHMFGGRGTKVYAYDFALNSFGESDLPEDLSRIWNEKYGGVADVSGYYNLETGTYYTTEYDVIPLPRDRGIKGFSASSRIHGEQGMVIEEFYYDKYQNIVFSDYAYIPFEKLNDGLQLADRICFMRHDAEKGNHLLQPEN